MLSIESDQFPQTLAFFSPDRNYEPSLFITINCNERLENNSPVSHQPLNKSTAQLARNVLKISYPGLLIGPIYTCKLLYRPDRNKKNVTGLRLHSACSPYRNITLFG